MSCFARLAALVLASWICVCSLAATVAADATFVGVLALAGDPAVMKELGLSEEVQKQLTELIGQREDDAAALVLEIKDLEQAEKDAKLAPYVAESEKQGLKLLTPEQQTKLQQIRVQRAGMAGLLEKAIADQVELTTQQRGQFDIMHQLFLRDTAAVPAAERTKVKVELERKMLGMLTKEQRAKWEALAGRVGGEVAQAAPPADPDNPTTEKPATEKPGTEKPAVGPAPRVPGTAGTGRPAGNTSLKPASDPLKARDPNVKLKFQFRYAPWREVIDWFADQADYSLVSDVYPPGTFNYSDSKAYTPAQGIDLLNSVLITKGYRLIRRERMLFLLSSEDELPDIFAPRIAEADLDKQGDFEIVQCQFQLSKITAEEAEVEVKKLVGLQGKVVVLSKAKQLVVTETAGTLRLIRNAIKSIENPETPKDEEVTVIKLENLRPSEFMLIARELVGIPAALNATPDGSLRIAVDELGMRILATGKSEKIEKINKLKVLLDVAAGGTLEGAPLEQPQLVIYSVENADPVSVLQILQTLLAGLPDVRLTLDPKSGNLVAHCRPSQHATIKATLDELQRDATQYKTFKLLKNDPQSMTLQINELFGGGDKPAPNAPKVVADPTNLQILVRASPAQLTKIQDLLKEMGELGGTTATTSTVRDKVRYLQGTGKSMESALSQVEAYWPTVHTNKLKVHRHKPNLPAQLQNNLNSTPAGPPGASRLQPLTSPPGADAESRRIEEEFGLPPGTVPGPSTKPAKPAVAPAKPAVAPAPVPAPTPKDTTTLSLPSGVWTHFVSQPAPVTEKEKEPAEPGSEPATPAEPKSVPGADITVSIGPNGIVIASEDLDALDELEARLRQIVDSRGTAKEPHIVYLKYAKAQIAATLLTEILSGAPASSEPSGGGGGLMGDLAQGMMGDMLGGLLGGLGGGGGAAASASGVTIIPDIRLNALIIQASPRDFDNVELYLQVIDQPSGPEKVETSPSPRFIPVHNTTADAIAVVVRQVFAGRMTADAAAGGGQPRQPNPEDLIRALRGGGRGGQQQQSKGEEQKMTVGVDTRTNSLIVSAPDYLFEEVKALVQQLDVSELSSDQVVKVVSLRSANADVITRSLGSMFGTSITTTKTATNSTTGRPGGAPPAGGGQRPGGPGAGQGGGQPPQGAPNVSNDVRAQMEIFNALQGGGNRGGGGGNRGGAGGFGGGAGGGGRGGR